MGGGRGEGGREGSVVRRALRVTLNLLIGT